MKNIDKLTKMFTERDNPQNIGMTIGEVISVSPIRIGYGESIILESRHMMVSYSFLQNEQLQSGDKVMMIPDNNNKIWYVIDKVVSV